MLADHVERKTERGKFILHQNEILIDYVNSLSGTVIKPELVNHFNSVSKSEDFWLDLSSNRLYSILLKCGIGKNFKIDMLHMLKISEMFRDMIDFRSRFTATHSSGVATTAATLTRLFGFTESEVELMKLAGIYTILEKW
jgi:HD-GYP domain-containing protein (c-di-GMP phosphodiesterase class II)